MNGAAIMPGDFALTRISGLSGRAIALAQAAIGEPSPVQHAFLYVGNGMIVQAQPGGAEMIPLADANEPLIWSSGIISLTAAQRLRIADAGRSLVGTPYSYADYLSIGLMRAHIRPRCVRRFVQSENHMICSQLVDEAYARGGVPLFGAKRYAGDVTPSDLWRLLREPR